VTDALAAIDELGAVPQWLSWRLQKNKDGKPTKVPYVANNGRHASATDPQTWTSYAKASAAYKKAGHDGLGFVVTADDPYCGIDLDHCRDPKTGVIADRALELLGHFHSYTEITPSETGIRIWIRGRKTTEYSRKSDGGIEVEIYDHDRYFTWTGNHLPGTPDTINERSTALAALCDELWPPTPAASQTAQVTAGPSLTAKQVVGLLKKDKNSAEFERLMHGDISKYNGDESRADEALCCRIVFYSRDREVIDQVVRMGMRGAREKWQTRPDYRKLTIDRALATVTESYRGNAGAPTLPDSFWEARTSLRVIRQAAHSRARSADAVLGAVLTRVSAGVPHQLRIPPIVGTAAPLNLFVNVMGPPGSGKSSAYGVAVELLPLVHPVDEPGKIAVADQLPIGSGEGLVEALFEFVWEKDETTGKARQVKHQTYYNASFYVDEGSALTALGNRAGSTTLSTLRTIFSGGVLGQANASMERKRIVPAGRYTMGVVVALQDELAGALLEGEAAGTPQRFVWLSAIDPSIPDVLPEFPSRGLPLNLDHTYRARGERPHDMAFAVSIKEEVRSAALARSRGEVVVESLQAHADLIRLKLAALLAILDGRLEVNDQDWQLATVVKATSDGVLVHVQEQVSRAEARKESQTSQRLARRQVDAVSAVDQHRTVECAKRIREKVKAQPGASVADVRRDLRRWRDDFDDGFAHAIAEKWVVEKAEDGQGTAKRALYPVVGEGK
jgi:hypothetical protein